MRGYSGHDEPQTIGPTDESTATAEGPELYVRVNIAKQSKGYVHETTVAVRWRQHDRVRTYPDPDERTFSDVFRVPLGRDPETDIAVDDRASDALRGLLRIADFEARREIHERQLLDDAERTVPS